MNKSNRAGIIPRIMAAAIITPIIIMGLLCASLYLPPLQEYATRKIENAVASNSEYSISIGNLSLSFPFNLIIKDFELKKEGECIACGNAIELNINPLPLLRSEVEVNYILLKQVDLDTHNLIDGTHIAGKIGHLRSAIRNIDLNNQHANIRQLYLEGTNLTININSTTDSKEEPTAPIDWEIMLQKGSIRNSHIAIGLPQDGTTIGAGIGQLTASNLQAHPASNNYKLKQLKITGSSVAYDHGTQPREVEPLNHLSIDDININGKDFIYSPATLSANIKQLSLKQPDGIEITSGSFAMMADNTLIKIERATLNSANGSYINATAAVSQGIFGGSSKSPIKASIATRLDKRDLKGFVTALQAEQLRTLPDSLAEARISLSGTPAKAIIDSVHITIHSFATMRAKGNLTHIGSKKQEGEIDFNGTIFDTSLLTGHKNDTTPTPLSLAGKVNIKESTYSTDINISGNGGGNIQARYNTESEVYDARINLKQFDIESSVATVPVKKLSMQASLEGAGTDIFAPETNYRFMALIDTLQYNSYIASKVSINAQQENSFSLVSIISQCPHSTLDLTAQSHIRPDDISNNTELRVKNIALNKVGLSDKSVSGSVNLKIEAHTDLDEKHRLKIGSSNIAINALKRKFTPADINIELATAPDSSYLNATNGDLSIKGTLASGYKQLLAQISKIEDMFLETRHSTRSIYYAHDFERLLPATSLNIKCGQNNMLHNYMAMNDVDLGDIDINCHIDSVTGIRARGAIYNIRTNNVKLDTVRFSATQEGEDIKYFAGVRSSALTPEREKQSFRAALFGNLQRDTLNTNFSFRGDDRSNDTRIGITTLLMPEGLNIHISPEAKVLGADFDINKDNYINIGKNENISANILATDQYAAGLHLYTINDSTAKHDINLSLFNINLKRFTASLPFTPDIAGTLNGDIRFRDEDEGILLSGDIYGDSIAYEGYYIGNETAEFVYLPKQKEKHIASLLLYHNNQKYFDLRGDYHNDGIINGSAKLTKLPLKVINAFVKDSNLEINGYIDGQLSLNGPWNNAGSNGYIKFDSVRVDAPLLGSQMRLVDDSVNIVDSKIEFNDFKIYAKGDTPFKINGDIDINHITNPAFNLRMQANNYELINSKRRKNSITYGKLFLDINSNITGTSRALKLYGNATILGNTNVTYVMPENSIVLNNELDGHVEFVNFQDTTKISRNSDTPHLGNLTMSMTLNIEDGAWINADFDSSRRSYINLQGGGQLNMNYTNESGLTLTGLYTLNNGQMKYDLSIIPLKTFNITQGSNIRWSGDIMNPTLDITALERVNASVSIDGGTPQPTAFDVGLVLSKTLNDIGLNFTLRAPENAAIQDELNSLDPETLNKYAVTMLVTGGYVGNEDGLTVTNALTSFIDAKINDIAGDAMKSVSINVGINTDIENKETGGSYSNYSFNLVKRFFNNRFTIVIGGEVNSGDTPEEENSFINNISLEWQLTDGGNRYLRIFYDKNYESILEGEITEAGVGYIYRRKLSSLSELLFIKPRNKQQPKENTKTQEQ